jgi:riboflavin kinase/FMN adenylyltransferase
LPEAGGGSVHKAAGKYHQIGYAPGAGELIAAIGAFDGFHKGHQALLDAARKQAVRAGLKWGTVTFYGHPDTLLVSSKFKSLFVKKERLVLEKFFSVPVSNRIKFTKDIAEMSPGEFLDFISEEFGIKGIVVGEGFRFGKNRTGTTELLERECRERGWIFEVVGAVRDEEGQVVSSTSIRESVAGGDMARVWEKLGYPLFYGNRVIHGNERGRTLGFPTANLEVGVEKVYPRKGVYATLAFALGQWYIGAANIGLNPTFDDVGELRFEVNVQDFDGDLYDREITVFMLRHIRDERRFRDLGSLKGQLTLDAAAVKKFCERALGEYSELWSLFKKALS